MSKKVDNKVKKKKKGLIFVSLIFLLTLSSIIATKTTFVNISSIKVVGNKELESEKIISLSGIILGENIFKANLKDAKENLKLHPYLKKVDIKRKLPNKVVIKVYERNEVAAIEYMGFYTYIDKEGLVLNIASEKKDNKTPLVKGLTIKDPAIGSKIDFNKDGENDKIISFLNSYSEKGLKDKTAEIEINKDLSVNVKLDTNVKVAFGTLNRVKYKLNFLSEVLKDLEGKNIKARTINLNKGNDIIVELDK